jgi:pimeloyl-ACP methyl ester carboxylesterase
MGWLHLAAGLFAAYVVSQESPVRGEFVDLGDNRLYYYAAGTRGAGEPVVLLHGFPASSFLWSAVVPRLPAGHRVIVPDLLGFGRSELPRRGHATSDLSVAGHAHRVTQLLDMLNVAEACIVGHGFSAAVALAIAIGQPKRVTRLCLVNAVTAASWPARDVRLARAVIVCAPVLPPGQMMRLARHVLRRGFANPAQLAHSADHYLRAFRSPGGRSLLLAHLRALTRPPPPISPELLPPVPASIIWGDRDRLLPAGSGHALRTLIPHATFDVVTGGHYTPEESPAQVATIVSHLLSAARVRT